MPKKNEKLEAAQDEIIKLQFEILQLRQEIKNSRRLERMRIAREILADEGVE